MTRVALVDPSAFTPAYDHALAAALSAAGARVDLFTSRFGYGDTPDPVGYARRELFYRRPAGAPGSRRRRAAKLATHAHDIRALARLTAAHADVVHLQWLAVPWLDVARLPDRPRVLTAHDLLPREPRPGQVGLQRRLMERMDAVIAHSRHGRDRLVNDLGLDPGRVHVVHHGALDHVAATPPGPLPPELTDTGGPVALFFGLLRPYKGLDTLAEAWRGITGGQLWIVGRPMMDLDALTGSGAQLVTRYVTEAEVSALFARADVGVLPYARTERFDQSGVLATALACGLPTVASDIGGFSEIAATGATRLVAPGDAAALHDALDGLLRDPAARAAMTDRARLAAAGPFSWRTAAADTLRLYDSLAGTSSPALRFRRTGLDDAEVRALLAELPWGVGDLTAPEFTGPVGAFVVGSDARGPVGCVGVRRLPGDRDRDGVGEVKRLFVRPPVQRRGVARALLTQAQDAARDLGYRELWLDTHADGPAALFASSGYAPIPAYNDHAYARYWFARDL